MSSFAGPDARFHAVLLVLEHGQELQPLVSKDTPAALLPVANLPVLSYNLRLLERCHVHDVTLVVAGKAQALQVVDWLSQEYLEPNVHVDMGPTAGHSGPSSSVTPQDVSRDSSIASVPNLLRQVLVVPEGFGSADALRALLSHRRARSTLSSASPDPSLGPSETRSSILVSTWSEGEESGAGRGASLPPSDALSTCSGGRQPQGTQPEPQPSEHLLVLDAFVICDISLGAVAAEHSLSRATMTAVVVSAQGQGGQDRGQGAGEKEKEKEKAAKGSKKAGAGARDVIGLDVATGKHLLFYSASWKGGAKAAAGTPLLLSRDLMATPGGILLRSDLRDARCYAFDAAALQQVLSARPHFSSLCRDVIPHLTQQQWKGSLAPSSGGQPQGSLLGQAPPTKCCAFEMKGSAFWCRVQSLHSYAEANHLLLSAQAVPLTLQPLSHANNVIHPSVVLGPKSAVGAHCMVGEGTLFAEKCSVKRSLVGRHCRIGANVKISDCVIMDYVTLESGCSLQNCTVAYHATVKEFRTLKDCHVGAYFVVSKDEKDVTLSKP